MSVTHEVTTTTIGHDFPVTVSLNLLTDIAHGCTEIANAVLVVSLTGVDTPTTGEMINDLTLLAEGVAVAVHNNISNLTCTPIERVKCHESLLALTRL